MLHSADAASRYHDLDEQGTKLWNLASRLKRDGSISTELGCLGGPPMIHSDQELANGASTSFCLPIT